MILRYLSILSTYYLHTYFCLLCKLSCVYLSRGNLVPRGYIVISTPSRLLCLNVFFLNLGARCSGLSFYLALFHFISFLSSLFFFFFFSQRE